MEAEQFKTWRKELGLTQKQAAAELGLAILTVQQYERGVRHDNKQKASIPSKVVVLCEEVSRRLLKERRTQHLRFRAVPDDMLETASRLLSERGVQVRLKPALSFFVEHYDPFSQDIDEWASNDMNVKGAFARFVVPMPEAPGGKVVALYFSDENEAFGFAVRFIGDVKASG